MRAILSAALFGGLWGSSASAGLVVSMNFEEAAGATVLDLATSDGTATPDDSGSLAGDAQRVPSSRGGQAVQFDGSGDFVSLGGQDFANGVSALTLAAWVKVHAFPQDIASLIFISRTGSTQEARAVLDLTSAGTVEAAGRAPDNSSLRWRVTTAPLPTDTWCHVAAVIDYAGQDVRIYVNGEPQPLAAGSTPFAATTSASDATVVTLGATGPSFEYFTGALDEVRVFTHALGASEIRELAGAPTPTPTPVATLRLDLQPLRARYSLAQGVVPVRGRVSPASPDTRVRLTANGRPVRVFGRVNWRAGVRLDRPGRYRVQAVATRPGFAPATAGAVFRAR